MQQENLFEPGSEWSTFDDDVRRVIARDDALQPQDKRRFSVAGAVPERVVFPGSVAEVSELVRLIERCGIGAVPVGLCAHTEAAGPPDRPFVAVSMSRLHQTIDFQPSNMTLTIGSGATLEALQTVAAKAGQWLPLDPPLAPQTTVGGLIAANLSGPARFSQGTVRDLLIGIKVVGTDGRIVNGGGRVVKNVAGYDLPKLFCGSEGTLGIIVEATFKLRPRPDAFRMLRVQCDDKAAAQEALRTLLASGLEPFLLELLSFVPPGDLGYNLVVGFSGSPMQVSHEVQRAKALLEPGHALQELSEQEAEEALEELRNLRVAGSSLARVKASLLPTQVMPFIRKLENEGTSHAFRMAVQAHAGNGIVHVRIRTGLPEGTSHEPVVQLLQRLRKSAEELGGALVVVGAAPALRARAAHWGSAAPGAVLMKKIKAVLDPKHTFSPGRFFPAQKATSLRP